MCKAAFFRGLDLNCCRYSIVKYVVQVFLWWNLNIFHTFLNVSLVDFKEVNFSPEWLTETSTNDKKKKSARAVRNVFSFYDTVHFLNGLL